MHVFYNYEGRIKCIDYPSSDEYLRNIPCGTNVLYFDDTEYSYLIGKSNNYKIINELPIYDPITDSSILLEEQESKIEEINLSCNLEIVGGFESICTTIKHKYKFDLEWQANLNRQMNIFMFDSTIESVEWNTIDVGWVTLSRQEFITLYQDSNRFIESKLNKYKELKEQVINCLTTDEVKLINW